MNDIIKSKGYEKLRKSVENDIKNEIERALRNQKEFNCSLSEDGCKNPECKCSHKYCDKFKWVIDRANHYAEKLNMSASEILDIWEKDRTYWYMNYYQDANQPLLDNIEDVYVYETNADVIKSFGNKGFRCPACKGVSSHPQICDSKIKVNNKICDWKSFGLFQFGLVTVVVKRPFSITKIFKPINWE